MSRRSFDSVIVGTGQAGKPLALALARYGHETAIIEKGRIGGTCIIDGCTPTKTMVASARVAHLAGRSSDFGVETGQVLIHMRDVRRRLRSVVDDFSESAREALTEQEGLELIEGMARFADPRTLEVTTEIDGDDPLRLTADRIFLNVGGRPRVPEIDGLADVAFFDSSSIMELDEVPGHLAVIGGGAVGLEFGQIFSRLGSDVTIIESATRLLGNEDRDVSEGMRRALEEEGITVLTNTATERVASNGDTGVRLSLRTADGSADLTASHLLLAVGRTSNADGLALEEAGLEPDEHGFIPVDDRCRTTVDGIWALGDVTGAPPFTHIAYDDYRVVASDVLPDRPERSRRDRMVPYTIYTDPELGRVGLTEARAEEEGRDFRVARLPMSSAARAIEMGETEGFLKCLVEDGTDRILGVAALAVHGGEIMSVLQTAMMADLPFTAIRDGIYAHPTLAESLQNLFASLDSDRR